MEFQQLQLLITRYNAGLATPEEKELLETWYHQAEGDLPEWDEIQLTHAKNEIYAGLQTRITNIKKPAASIRSFPVRKMFPALKWAAACFIIALGIWFYFSKHINTKDLVKQKPAAPVRDSIVPGGNIATLMLASGRTIELKDIKVGRITSEETTVISKNGEGEIVYHVLSNDAKSSGVHENTIVTPRGGAYMVTLPDGTKVWLNASSSLRFPVAFTGSERKVELTGEAYFEVAKNARMPFRVSFSHQTVEVLGTHFNINAYTDEPASKTTLLEGAIKIISSLTGDGKKLVPGEAASIQPDGRISIARHINTEESVAWKNGSFNFREADIPAVMRQISRWYNAEVRFSTSPATVRFNGKIPRNATLSNVMEILALNGIHCSVDGRTIVIK